VEYPFVTLAEHQFFGPEQSAGGGHQALIAKPEKTLADSADQPNHGGGVRELTKGIREGPDGYVSETLIGYARRIGNGAALM
jgi:predicted transcriptional regulator of viral defense system